MRRRRLLAGLAAIRRRRGRRRARVVVGGTAAVSSSSIAYRRIDGRRWRACVPASRGSSFRRRTRCATSKTSRPFGSGICLPMGKTSEVGFCSPLTSSVAVRTRIDRCATPGSFTPTFQPARAPWPIKATMPFGERDERDFGRVGRLEASIGCT